MLPDFVIFGTLRRDLRPFITIKGVNKSFKKLGINVLTSSSLEKVDFENKNCIVSIKNKNGIEKIVEINLSDAEKDHLMNSAEAVKKNNSALEF